MDESQRARFEERTGLLCGLDWAGRARDFDRFQEVFASELDELDVVPSLEIAHDLLDRIDRRRRDLLEPRAAVLSGAAEGSWLCHWPGRSLATGEAEIASRGFFDVRDRPPLGLWVEAIGRRIRAAHTGSGGDAFELAILCWVPPAEVPRARAGRRACASGALAFLDEVSDLLNDQLRTFCSAPSPE